MKYTIKFPKIRQALFRLIAFFLFSFAVVADLFDLELTV